MCKKILKASAHLIDPQNKQNNFELFGLDFMIDNQYKPYLIEVNSNPCLQMGCPLLSKLLPEMIDNLFRITIDSMCPPPLEWPQSKKIFLK